MIYNRFINGQSNMEIYESKRNWTTTSRTVENTLKYLEQRMTLRRYNNNSIKDNIEF